MEMQPPSLQDRVPWEGSIQYRPSFVLELRAPLLCTWGLLMSSQGAGPNEILTHVSLEGFGWFGELQAPFCFKLVWEGPCIPLPVLI